MIRTTNVLARLMLALLCCAVAAGCTLGGPTPPETPSSATPLTVSVTQDGDRATISWTSEQDPAEGWRVARDGHDSGGYGPWSDTIAADLRTWTFNYLVKDNTYNLTVSSSVGTGSVTIVAGSQASAAPQATPPERTIPARPTQPEGTPTAPAGRKGWLSGVGTKEQGNGPDPAQYFADWRGAPVEIGQTWPNTPDLWSISPTVSNSWAGFTGPMSLSFAPGEDWRGLQGWRSYEAIARGDMDDWWRAAAQYTRQLRAGRGPTYVSPFYEYNGDWMEWSVTRTTQGYADFRNAWARVAGIWREEFPEAKLVLVAACVRNVPSAMLPDPKTYDMGGCTIYNAWPWKADGSAALRFVEVGRKRAEAVGKPFGITEWANSASSETRGGGGDAPGFVSAMHDWLKAHAGSGPGQVVFETFFNIDGYPLDHILLRPDGGSGTVSDAQPRTAARYRELWGR